MNNAMEISEEITNIEKSVKMIRVLMRDTDIDSISYDERDKIFAHLNHLVKQKNAIKGILNS
jgi:hypothetical protein